MVVRRCTTAEATASVHYGNRSSCVICYRKTKKRKTKNFSRAIAIAIATEEQSNLKNCLFREFTPSGKCQKMLKNVKKKLWGPIFCQKYPPPPKMVIFPLYKRLNVHFFPPAPTSIVGRRRKKKYLRLIAP